jgi:hypothetical protein
MKNLKVQSRSKNIKVGYLNRKNKKNNILNM